MTSPYKYYITKNIKYLKQGGNISNKKENGPGGTLKVTAYDVIKYMQSNIDTPDELKIEKIAKHFYVSPTTIYRIGTSQGFKNFSSFKIDLISKNRLYQSSKLKVSDVDMVNTQNLINFVYELASGKQLIILDPFGLYGDLLAKILSDFNIDVSIIYKLDNINTENSVILSFREDVISFPNTFYFNKTNEVNNVISSRYELEFINFETLVVEVYHIIINLLKEELK